MPIFHVTSEKAEPSFPKTAGVPLCVDLDGTLIRTDLLWECLTRLIRQKPFHLLLIPYWLIQGKAVLKRKMALLVEMDIQSLPFNAELLAFLRDQRLEGRTLVLATASDQLLADKVAAELGIFSETIGSDGTTNVKGADKGKRLSEKFGPGGFDYAGDSTADLKVWAASRHAIVVNADEKLTHAAAEVTSVERVFSSGTMRRRNLVKALRPHQWAKNVIVFVPLLTGHKLTYLPMVLETVWMFVAFCLAASGFYIWNDLLDLEADRHHPRKRKRPFASGEASIGSGMILGTALIGLSLTMACFQSKSCGMVVGAYLLMNGAYSFGLKKLVLWDVFILSALYTVRLVAGNEATGLAYSVWLLVFSTFMFLSLALIKRFQELAALGSDNKQQARGRGYTVEDLELVRSLGTTSGFMAVLVLALYVNSEQVHALYGHPLLLLLLCPMMLFWISRAWLIAHRGKMHVDPVVFALTDRFSYGMAAFLLVLLWLASK